MRPRRSDLRAGLVAACVTAMVGALFAWLGGINGDEGWYALDAKAVGLGKIPYRDFALPQGPLYLYVLAPFVRIWPDLSMTRAVSVMLSTAAVALLIVMAYRVGGRRTAIVCGVALAATFPALPYWLSITKTYALSFFLLAAIVFCLAATSRSQRAFPIAASLCVLFVATRPTGIAIAVFAFAALLHRGPDRTTRVRSLAAAIITGIPFALLLSMAWPNARWGLFDYHQLHAKADPGAFKFVQRTLGALRAWPGPAFLAVAAVVAVLCHAPTRSRLRGRSDVLAFAIGIPLFVFLHETGSSWFAEEYLAPVIGIMVVGSCIVLLKVFDAVKANASNKLAAAARPQRRRSTRWIPVLLIVGIVGSAATGGHADYLGMPGWAGSVAGLDRVVGCIQRHSKPSDAVFSMYLEELVLQSNRRAVDGVSIGAFSYEDVTTRKARALHILNSTTIVNVFTRRPPKVLVLTLFDFDAQSRAGWFSKRRIDRHALDTQYFKYKLVCTITIERNVLWNIPVKVDIYERRKPAV